MAHEDHEAETPPPRVVLERRQKLERLLHSNPTNLEAFLELAAIYRSENRPVEARRTLKQALDIFPDNEDLLYQYEESILARSLQQFREVTDLANRLHTPEADRELARARHDWAMRRIEVCRARLNRQPDAKQLFVQLAEAQVDAEDYDQAAETLRKVIDIDEYAAASHLLIARCKLARGEDLSAMKSLRACAMRRAVTAPPHIRVMALKLLCETATRLGVEETLTTYQAALAAAQKELAAARDNTKLPPPGSTEPGSPNQAVAS